jgi:hypothetical protein
VITKFINEIRINKYFSPITYKDEWKYSFTGDGWGDYEEIEDDATKETVESYIIYCKEQIELAKKYLVDTCIHDELDKNFFNQYECETPYCMVSEEKCLQCGCIVVTCGCGYNNEVKEIPV